MVETRDTDLDRLMGHLKERDVAYTALQGVASSYLAQIQEAARVVSSGGPDRFVKPFHITVDASTSPWAATSFNWMTMEVNTASLTVDEN
ncbi:hypothetical protein PF005_g15666 [Phytophthora fragariae]|uniref:Uncharacterized protein n=1 Tax=Phytophthora fragariae TaxID=53985 RepID=A0A6A3EF45_9STRA|nr:hypothetical protein PF003_g33041 [Phytophthora fragariae]KAE8932225.1 hypothetical protein PF009_g17734 [Phytophthora fragariae]KAE9094079.1 hypothetical protein PF007_g17892 [Phytophthora fragariae]KAE9199599.1 hypothetical protein PF005_g15666 [Phytophthora fragariae]KAE9296714.1 hypothetical protein PF001_g16740 [Phytophthora fragariae]